MKNWQKTAQSLLDQMVAEGTERGVQVAAYFQGELVVDAFSGTANITTGEPVTGETLFPVFSTTKGLMSTIIHRLAQRGELDYEAPIAAFWPEFGARGKQNITIRHALTHTAGLPYLPLNASLNELCDWDFMCAAIAGMEPVSAPGERVEYHAITFGWIVGEVASRVAKRPLPTLWQEELCAPLALEATMFCGLPAALEWSVALLEDLNVPAPEPPVTPQLVTPQVVPSELRPLGNWMNRSDARRTCNPASNGIMNARAVARHYAALLPGGVGGVELLPASRVQVACARESNPSVETAGFGLGYQVGNLEWFGSSTTFGHGGYGGSLGIADPESGWAFGFTRNRFSEANSVQRVLESLRDSR